MILVWACFSMWILAQIAGFLGDFGVLKRADGQQWILRIKIRGGNETLILEI